MYQSAFPRCYRCLDAGFFVIDDNLQRRFNLSTVVNDDMTHANTAGNYWNGRLLNGRALCSPAPPRGINMSMYLSMRSISFTSARFRTLDSLDGTRR